MLWCRTQVSKGMSLDRGEETGMTGRKDTPPMGAIDYRMMPIHLRSTLALPDESLWGIIMFQFLPLLTIAGVLMTFFNRKTGRIYAGVFLFSTVLSWIVVASTASHYAF